MRPLTSTLAATITVVALATATAGAERGLSSSTRPGETACLDEVCFPSRTTVGPSSVPLHNVAMLEIWGFDVYTAALYVPPGVDTVDEVLRTAPKKLILHYHRSIRAQQIIKAAEKALRKNPEINREVLDDRLQRMYTAFRDVDEGDRYELRHDPERGSILSLNGEVACVVEGNDFAEAFFGIWLSDTPLNATLRDALIGLSS